jgi:Na+/melibiose symporter-like transporter
MGMVTGPFFVLERDNENHSDGKQRTNLYMFYSAIIISAMNIGTIIFFKESPKIPPSYASISKSKTKYSMKKDGLALLKNKNYILLVIVFSMLFGVYTTLGACIDDLASSYNYSNE